MKYTTFTFEKYIFDSDQKTLACFYNIDDTLQFCETYHFELDTLQNIENIEALCQLVFLTAGISYYKTYLPPIIAYGEGIIVGPQLAAYLQFLYREGLGEFFYVNNLDPFAEIVFPVNGDDFEAKLMTASGPLIGIGGGKDSIVSVEALRGTSPTTWSVGHKKQLSRLVATLDTPHIFVSRTIDSQLINKTLPDAYSGHVPISAVFASVGALVAALSGKRDVIVSNESSANEATLQYREKSINHQFSKSLQFEKAFQSILHAYHSNSLRYFSYLRNLDELQISETFAAHFAKYKDVFSSCNKAFRQDSDALYWCESCPKCAFVYLALSAFITGDDLADIFSENLILKPSLHETYTMLLGMTDRKPLECVGTIAECRWAMEKAAARHPEIKAKFTLENDYSLTQRSEHVIPADYELL
jgi:UDP-N-acetyl-alpha-D-muramoyl-L-alanyl-L-glutamate epimerase